MITVMLVVLGLVLGSFVNALVWRIRYQETAAQKSKASKLKTDSRYSILKGRSMCPNCKHELAAKDLVPVLSWLSVRGKCRYCHKPISAQYPLVELATAALFILSYYFWPASLVSGPTAYPTPHLFHGSDLISSALFALWLVLLVGLMALIVYDIRWFLLPNRIVYPLSVIAGLMAILRVASAPRPLDALINVILAIAVGGGIFYVLFQVSGGKWIGGGDVKLGWLLGMVVGTPGKAVLFIFIASLFGMLFSLPLLLTHRLKRSSTIPFGPFLIVGAIFSMLFGDSILHWYVHTILLVG